MRESTKQGNDKVARQMESAHRTSLAKGEVGIRVKEPVPTLKEFINQQFLPYVKTRHATKPNTLRYYEDGSAMLTKSELAGLGLDELTDQHAQQFARQHFKLSPSGINHGLRTLRRALNVAFQWKTLEKPVKVMLATGERQRDRVLSDTETNKYLAACPQPWKDCATIILEEGFRPSEVFSLRWSHVFFNKDGTGLIQVMEGKSKAAHRMLPMTPRVYELLGRRYEEVDCPSEEWIFPSSSECGHFNGDAAKDQHKKALTDSSVKPFVPYTLRHTALTKLAEKAGGDVFVLARIAGHSSLTVTQRYIHPQADAINRVFAASQSQVGTKLGTLKGTPKLKRVKASG
ncbi:MAG TPA: site-specific integrase [Candidatus Dormibacteraeota bacterium]|nr:site-specific integrase [Candidatus Dormibacteraeota bacterium]